MRRTAEIFQYVVGSAVFMGLGWQLPGNAAGVFLALWLCIVLRIEMRRAAPIVAIAALSLYETRFLLSGYTPFGTPSPWPPVAWVASAGMRGFVFGAFLGLGLVLKRLGLPRFYALLLGFTVACAGSFFALYAFRSGSLPDIPRGHEGVIRIALNQDLWAGLLLGTLTLLLGLWAFRLHRVPVWFSLSGAAGGAAGFALSLLLQEFAGLVGGDDAVEVLRPWILGATMGGACGGCALWLRNDLYGAMEDTAPEPWRDLDYKVLGLSTAAVLFLFYWLDSLNRSLAGTKDVMQPAEFLDSGWAFALFVCAFVGCLMLWAARSTTVAWQIAVTVPIFASLSGFLAYPSMGGHSASSLLFFITLLLVAGGVFLWQYRSSRPLAPMALGLLWIGAACALATAPAYVALFEWNVGTTVFRSVLLGVGTLYCTAALWSQWKINSARPAPRPA
jgi:hypothetical protein